MTCAALCIRPSVIPDPPRLGRSAKSRWATLATVVALAASPAALTRPQSAVASAAVSVVQYDAAFYTQFTPRTALDMVNQTPGFVLETGEGDSRRGFEGSVGNVLIDGERPTAKGEGLTELLRGIPATRVVRIEIRRSADTAGDASGTRVLANVVLRPAPWQGAWAVGLELANRYVPAPNGYAALAGKVGSTDVVLNASTYSLWRDLPATRVLVDDAGAVAVTRQVESPRHYDEYKGGGQAIRPAAGGRMELTAKTSFARYADQTALTTADARTAPSTEHVPYAQRERSTEAGLSYKRPAHGWEWTALSLVTFGHFDSDVTSTGGAGPPASPLVTQPSRRDTRELVARLSTVRSWSRGSAQFGVEGARNTLDGAARLVIDFGEGDIDLPVSNADVRVVEDRGEASASGAWRPDERWSLDGRIGIELSNLRFHGDIARSTRLAYVKPSLSLTRTFENRTQVYGRFLRTVGQLNFADFVATSSLADQQWMGTNPTLKPQASWRIEAGSDLRRRPDTGVNVVVFHDWFTDIVDWTVWGEGDDRVDARGNIGSGQATGVTISYRSPVPGVPGLVLTTAGTVQRTRVVDPLTREPRPISEREPARLDVSLRQNLRKAMAIGASYAYRDGASAYRLREIDWKRVSPSLDAFFECPLPRSLRLRVQGTSLLGSPERRRRRFFDPDRTGGTSTAEHIDGHPGHWWVMQVSGSF